MAVYERANSRQQVLHPLVKMNEPSGLVFELNISLVNREDWWGRWDPHAIFVNLSTIAAHICECTATSGSASLGIPIVIIWVLRGVVFLATQRCALIVTYLASLKLLQLFQGLSRSVWNLRIGNQDLFLTFLITAFAILIALHLLLLSIHLLLQLLLFVVLGQHFER